MEATHAAPRERPAGLLLGGRLGLNVPNGWWPAAATLKAYQAAGFGWVQVHAPPAAVLVQERGPSPFLRAEAVRHAEALRSVLDTGGLRLVLHGPDGLMAGEGRADRAMVALTEYAARAGAEHVVYHGMNVAPGGHERLRAEERALASLARRARDAVVTLAVENLAPVNVVPHSPRACHDPAAVAALVERLDSDHVRMCLDVGHAHIVGAALDVAPRHIALFHVHDNLGGRGVGRAPRHLDPLRLDLHLPPGAGTVRWERVRTLLAAAPHAPVQLEVHPPHRPEPLGLAEVTAALLGPL